MQCNQKKQAKKTNNSTAAATTLLLLPLLTAPSTYWNEIGLPSIRSVFLQISYRLLSAASAMFRASSPLRPVHNERQVAWRESTSPMPELVRATMMSCYLQDWAERGHARGTSGRTQVLFSRKNPCWSMICHSLPNFCDLQGFGGGLNLGVSVNWILPQVCPASLKFKLQLDETDINWFTSALDRKPYWDHNS